MDYHSFKKKYASFGKDIFQEIFRNNQDVIRIKREKTALGNLEKIFNAVFSISCKKGFHAMSMRDLSEKTNISLGALYGYFPGKKQLLSIIQSQGDAMIRKVLAQSSIAHKQPRKQLASVIRAHVFMSEMYRPWFYFIFMEAGRINPAQFKAVESMEKYSGTILVDILKQGEHQKVFKPGNHELTAGMIKAMQQEWYLKRWKYRRPKITVDEFADHLIAVVEAFCLAG